MWYEAIIDRGLVPESVLRLFVRLGLKKYESRVLELSEDELCQVRESFKLSSSNSEIAINTEEANGQHYEMSSSVYEYFLGPSMKYSGSEWPSDSYDLTKADLQTIRDYINKCRISDGDSVLELGCGWGSLSLEIANLYKKTFVTAVTNSTTQKRYIEQKASQQNIYNLEVVKCDINQYVPTRKYDRIISIEMFEHIRNPKALMSRIDTWLNSRGNLFIQVFSHKVYPQYFDDRKTSWMSKYFFTGGMMPYDGFYKTLNSNLENVEIWKLSGQNYHRSLESWLSNFKLNKKVILRDMDENGHGEKGVKHFNRYKLFLIFCSELFDYNYGSDWYILHYLFIKRT